MPEPRSCSPVEHFFAGLDSVEAQRVGTLMTSIERGASRGPLLETMLQQIDALPRHRALRTFARALLERSSPSRGSCGNLYLDGRPPGTQLQAFEILRLRTPMIPFAYAASNRNLLRQLSERPQNVTLVEIGIGNGGQVRALLRHPCSRRRIRRLHVVAIEPDGAALEHAKANVLATAAAIGIPTTFDGLAVRAEEIDRDMIARRLRGRSLANAAFCLHHVVRNAAAGRIGVLAAVRQAGVEFISLVEPDSDHATDELTSRLRSAYCHYRTVDRALQSVLDPADADKVWQEFFEPEIHNILTFDGPLRTERHEVAERWVSHLRTAGWRVDGDLPDLTASAAAPPGFGVLNRDHAFSLTHSGVPVLSVIGAHA